MKAVITAAARSPRLLPLTKNTPVSMLEVAGKPIIGHQLDNLKEAGIEDILVITGFCARQVEEFCQNRATCIFNPFYDTCNIALNLWLVRDEFDSGFILQYADTLFQSALIKELFYRVDGIVLVVDPKGIDKEAEKVVLQDDRVTSIGKNVERPYGEFVGMAKFSPKAIPALVQELEKIARSDLDTSFPRLAGRLIDNGEHVSVQTTSRPWIDIDFPEDLDMARRIWPTEGRA